MACDGRIPEHWQQEWNPLNLIENGTLCDVALEIQAQPGIRTLALFRLIDCLLSPSSYYRCNQSTNAIAHCNSSLAVITIACCCRPSQPMLHLRVCP